MRLEYSARTETGPVRPENQDAFHADPVSGLFIVCDGMGGHNAGALASTIAIEVVAEHIAAGSETGEDKGDGGRALVTAAINAANQAILERASGDRALLGMGTTCTLVLIRDDGRCMMGHVGDSRLYLDREQGIRQISMDHSYVQELVNCGALKPEEAATHPQRNIITRALGLAGELNVDTLEFTFEAGDTLLLCSDGLSGYFPDDIPLHAGAGDPILRQGLDRLVDHALASGGKDNITCILVRSLDP